MYSCETMGSRLDVESTLLFGGLQVEPAPVALGRGATLDEPQNRKSSGGLAGLRVLSLESRRAQEMAKLIANYGGVATVAPSMREVPLASNTEALAFARTLIED